MQPDRSAAIAKSLEEWPVIHKNWIVALESMCWAGILAPSGIAPRTMRPFTVKSNLNCADWLSFTKVTGKYLFSQLFSQNRQALTVICDILDYFSMCLDHELTEAKLDALDEQASLVAGHIENFFPGGEKSLVLHHMVFHMPGQLRVWGPARASWVFPYERSVVAKCCIW